MIPDDLVALQLKSDRQVIVKNPPGQIVGFHSAENGSKVYAQGAVRRFMHLPHDLPCIVVVPAIADDKFHLVSFGQPLKIQEVVEPGLTTGRTLDIKDFHATGIDTGNVKAAVGFQKDRIALFDERMDQYGGFFLK